MTATTTETTTRKTKAAPLTADEKAARLQEAQDTMAREVAKLKTSDDWLRWLKTARRFHNYSWSNILLAMAQGIERDMAPITRLAGFHAWLDLGRSVNKGERGLKIFAPILVKIKPGEKGYNPSNPDRKKIVGFRLTSTFDVQQTSGEPLAERPTFTYPSGEVPFGLHTALIDYAASIGFPVTFEAIPGGQALGFTDPRAKRIAISSEIEDDDARACRTIIHEIGHASLHMADDYDYTGHRGVAETEAESVAYMVGDYFGIDMGEQSFHYVAGWAPDLETVVKVGDRILKTAKAIITGVEPDVQQVKVEAEPAVAEPAAEPEAEPVAEPEPVKAKPVRKPRKSRAKVKSAEPVTATATVATPNVAAIIDANLKAQREAAKPVAEAAPSGPPVVGGAWALFA